MSVRTPSDIAYLGDGIETGIERLDNQGGQLVSGLHGDMVELAQRERLFGAANQAAKAVSVALTATYTGLCVSNPAASTKNLAIRSVGIALSVAPAAIAPMGIGGGFLAAGVTAHTSALTPFSMKIGSGATVTAKADDECTLVGTPQVIRPLLGGFTAAALFPHSVIVDLKGEIVVIPGAYVFIYALTAVTGIFSMTWEEIPRS